MSTEIENKKPALLWSVLSNRCPRCRNGHLFSHGNPYNLGATVQMPDQCPVCGQRFELQTGFYFGTGFVSYALSVMVLAMVFVAYGVIAGLSYKDNSIFWCLGLSIAVLIVLQPPLQRLSRSIWISFFVKYDKDWQSHKGSSEIFS